MRRISRGTLGKRTMLVGCVAVLSLALAACFPGITFRYLPGGSGPFTSAPPPQNNTASRGVEQPPPPPPQSNTASRGVTQQAPDGNSNTASRGAAPSNNTASRGSAQPSNNTTSRGQAPDQDQQGNGGPSFSQGQPTAHIPSQSIYPLRNNETLRLRPAVYDGSIVIDANQVTLIGAGFDQTVINGNVTIRGNNCTLTGLTINGSVVIEANNANLRGAHVNGHIESRGSNNSW